MISKELLESVLEFTSGNVFIKGIETRNNDIEYLCNVGGWTPINIYELAYKCKEWAFEKGYAFKIEYLGVKDVNIQLINHDTETTSYSKDFYNIQDIEQIILPCQWILDNKED